MHVHDEKYTDDKSHHSNTQSKFPQTRLQNVAKLREMPATRHSSREHSRMLMEVAAKS